MSCHARIIIEMVAQLVKDTGNEYTLTNERKEMHSYLTVVLTFDGVDWYRPT